MAFLFNLDISFESTDASVMIIHSTDDDVIGIEYGLNKYYGKYENDDSVTFIRFDNRSHNEIFNDPNNTYKDEFNAEFDQWLKTLEYDYKSEENKDRFAKDKADYITENLDGTATLWIGLHFSDQKKESADVFFHRLITEKVRHEELE